MLSCVRCLPRHLRGFAWVVSPSSSSSSSCVLFQGWCWRVTQRYPRHLVQVGRLLHLRGERICCYWMPCPMSTEQMMKNGFCGTWGDHGNHHQILDRHQSKSPKSTVTPLHSVFVPENFSKSEQHSLTLKNMSTITYPRKNS